MAVSQGVYDRVHNNLYNVVAQAAAHVVDQQPGWSVEEISKKAVKHLYKGCSDPEIMKLPWNGACKEIVTRGMTGYSSACGEQGWFFEVDLTSAFMGICMELLIAAGKEVSPEAVYEVVQSEYEDVLDRAMLDKAIWDVSAMVFGGEGKIASKVFQALSRSYWPTLDEVLNDGNLPREMMYGLDEQTELRRVENFTRRWLDDGIGRAWVSIENSEAGLNERTLKELLRHLIVPFGEDHPYSCLPGAFIDRLGRPPPDWAFIKTCVADLLRGWSKGSKDHDEGPAKKKRKGGRGKKAAAPEEEDDFAKAILPGADPDDDTIRVPAEDGEGFGHPKCTSADDCIGSPLHPLIRHMHNGKPGDIYCEPCWESFCQRNANLKGIPFEDDEDE